MLVLLRHDDDDTVIRANVGGVTFCHECREEAAPEDILSDVGWARLMASVSQAGLPIPSRPHTRLEFIPLN